MYAVVIGAPPLLFGCSLLVRTHMRERRRRHAIREEVAVRQSNRLSVEDLARRVARDRPHEQHDAGSIRWPRTDPDRGVIRDERPTITLPLVPGEPVDALGEFATEELPVHESAESAPESPEPRRVRPYTRRPVPNGNTHLRKENR
jgi:hypothetical protein